MLWSRVLQPRSGSSSLLHLWGQSLLKLTVDFHPGQNFCRPTELFVLTTCRFWKKILEVYWTHLYFYPVVDNASERECVKSQRAVLLFLDIPNQCLQDWWNQKIGTAGASLKANCLELPQTARWMIYTFNNKK